MKRFILLIFSISLILIVSSCSIKGAVRIYSETEIKQLYQEVVFSKNGYITLSKEQLEDIWGKGSERKIEGQKVFPDKYVMYDCKNGGKLYLFYTEDIPVEASFSMINLSEKDFENVKVGKTTKADVEKIDPATEFTYCEQSKIWDNGVDKCSRHFTNNGILYILYEEGKDEELIVKDLKFIYENIVDEMSQKDLF